MNKPKKSLDNLFFEFTDDEVFYLCQALQYYIDCMEHPDIGELGYPNTPPRVPVGSTLDAQWQMGEDLRYRMSGPVFARLDETMKAEKMKAE